jgi:hypothetical protein
MIEKSPDSISAEDLEQAVALQIPEGKNLDYKVQLPGDSDAEKKEFLSDVTSFANANGGLLVYGVDESEGVPTSIPGVAVVDADETVRRLNSIIESGISPRPEVSVRALKLDSGQTVIVVGVYISWRGPHRVDFKGHHRFYGRNSAGKYPLDVEEIRSAVLRSAGIADRLCKYHEERVLEIAADRGPVNMMNGAKLIMHLVPLSAFTTTETFSLAKLYSRPEAIPPLTGTPQDWRITVEGFLTTAAFGKASSGYTHIHRSGIIELVDGLTLNRDNGGRRAARITLVERRVYDVITRFLEQLRQLGVRPPVFLYATLHDVKGLWLVPDGDSSFVSDHRSLDRHVLSLPPLELTDFETMPSKALRRTCDTLWHAIGAAESTSFENDGTWKYA